MELKMNQYQLPEKVNFNYEELKTELQAKVSQYESLIYSDEQIKDAKADKAQLNKLKKALNDERIRLQKEYMIPFNEFKEKIDELISIIDKPVLLIDQQVKGYEEQKKAEKLEAIKAYWHEVLQADKVPEAVTFNQIFNEKWLNATVSMKSIQEEINARLEQIASDLATLQNLPEFSFEAVEVYKTTLNLGKAIQEGQRLAEIQKRKEEAERQKAEREAEQARLAAEAEAKKAEPQPQPAVEGFINPPVEEAPAKQWVSFKALLTVDEARELKKFFDDKCIEYEAI